MIRLTDADSPEPLYTGETIRVLCLDGRVGLITLPLMTFGKRQMVAVHVDGEARPRTIPADYIVPMKPGWCVEAYPTVSRCACHGEPILVVDHDVVCTVREWWPK